VYKNARSVMAIHNLKHQGVFPPTTYDSFGLPPGWYCEWPPARALAWLVGTRASDVLGASPACWPCAGGCPAVRVPLCLDAGACPPPSCVPPARQPRWSTSTRPRCAWAATQRRAAASTCSRCAACGRAPAPARVRTRVPAALPQPTCCAHAQPHIRPALCTHTHMRMLAPHHHHTHTPHHTHTHTTAAARHAGRHRGGRPRGHREPRLCV
jgi:hypothetical protein